MKHLVIFLLLLFTLNSYSQQRSDSIAVSDLLNEYYKTWNTRDIKATSQYCMENFIWMDGGDMMSFSDVINLFEKNNYITRNRTDTMRIKYFRIAGDISYLCYYHQRTLKDHSIPKKDYWEESAIFHRINNVWKIELIHSTEINHW